MTSPFQALKTAYANATITKPEFIRQALDIHQGLFQYVEVARNTDVHEIRITAEGVSFALGAEDIRLFCPENEARVAPIEVMNFNQYEPAETRAMDILTRRAQVILDVGANIGLYAVRFAKRLPQARVYAFEPLPTSYAYLQRNVAANQVGDRVASFNYGLSDSDGTVEFFISPAAGTNASLKNVAATQDARRVLGLVLTLDQWTANQNVVPDFIKCDVEGAELLVFRGGENTLRQHTPIVFAELLRKWSKPFGYHPNDMLTYFAGLGYQCFAVGDAGVRPIQEVTDETVETNYAFLHAQRHAATIAELVQSHGA